MEDRLRERVVGQEEAITAVANTVRAARAGLGDPNRPIGSFLFLGPTGVGKTETARALAEFLFDDESALIRIDMSEYQERHTVSRLIGAPPGYVGYDEAGQLTEAVRRRPYSVVLFDEVEKAHPEVLNILLQLLDDGRLTDAQGRTVNFQNTIVIMTSNLGSQHLLDPFTISGGGVVDLAEREAARMRTRERVMDAVREHFRPELLNRIDDIVIFNPLGKEQIKAIVDIQLDGLRERLARAEDGARAHRRGQGAPGDRGLRPGLRRPAAEARDPAEDRPAAGHPSAARRVPRRRHDRRGRPRHRHGIQSQGGARRGGCRRVGEGGRSAVREGSGAG